MGRSPIVGHHPPGGLGESDGGQDWGTRRDFGSAPLRLDRLGHRATHRFGPQDRT